MRIIMDIKIDSVMMILMSIKIPLQMSVIVDILMATERAGTQSRA